MTPSKSAVPFWFAVEPIVSTKRLTSRGRRRFSSATLSAVGSVALRGGGRERREHGVLNGAEELDRAHPAEEAHRERVHDELVDRRSAAHHDPDVAPELARGRRSRASAVSVKSSAATPIGASCDHHPDQPHGDVVEPLQRLLEARRRRRCAGGETDPDHQREEHDQPSMSPSAAALTGLSGHDLVHDEIETGRGALGHGGDGAAAAPRSARRSARARLRGHAVAGTQQLDEADPEQHGDRGDDHRVHERARRRCAPASRTSPMPATPSASAEKMSGTTSMNSRRRKIWPTGCTTQRSSPSSHGVPAAPQWAKSPRITPAPRPNAIRV